MSAILSRPQCVQAESIPWNTPYYFFLNIFQQNKFVLNLRYVDIYANSATNTVIQHAYSKLITPYQMVTHIIHIWATSIFESKQVMIIDVCTSMHTTGIAMKEVTWLSYV